MRKLFWVIVVLAAFVAAESSEKIGESPAAGPDCSLLVFDVIDCISFISIGGSDEKPSESCCSGIKTVVKTDDDCVCEALKISAQLGINLNMTKAMALPSACGVSSPSLSTCNSEYAAPDSAPIPAPEPGAEAEAVPAPALASASASVSEPVSSPVTAPAPAPKPESVLPPAPEVPVVETPTESTSDTTGGSSFDQSPTESPSDRTSGSSFDPSPAPSPASGTLSSTVTNPCLVLFSMVAAAIFHFV